MDIKTFLLNSISEVIIVKDVAGKIVYQNRDIPKEVVIEVIAENEVFVPYTQQFYAIEILHNVLDGQLLEISIYRNITDQINAQRKAYTDQLTGALNRTGLMNELSKCQNQYNQFSYLVVADLDQFKRINDQFGHIAGDAVLKAVTVAMQEELSVGDILCRYGGDEFLILLKNSTEDEATTLLENLSDKIKNKKVPYEDIEITVSITFGTAVFDPSLGIIDLIHQADLKMYENKKVYK